MRCKRALGIWLAGAALVAAGAWWLHRAPDQPVLVHEVYPGDDIQEALEAAAGQPGQHVVRVHAGTYRPRAAGQALIYLNARHDGIVLEAVGAVTLTAANPDIADPANPSYPAVVNHVIYLGDGLSDRTVVRGFKVTGANGYVDGPADLFQVQSADDLSRADAFRTPAASPIESSTSVPRTFFFYTDGGGILVYGRSYPTLENVEVLDNYSTVCGAGVSVQHHLDYLEQPVRFKDCVFRNNRTAISGSAVDLLSRGSWASFENCLFAGNASNEKLCVGGGPGYGALTVFPACRATVASCTFTGNRRGVDDRGTGCTYARSIFWNNNLAGGADPNPLYEVRVREPWAVKDCFIHGNVNDPLSHVSAADNKLDPSDPNFGPDYEPRTPAYQGIGYRPLRAEAAGITQSH